ncbi:Pimeloyl-ACP methyl ester carboxylesterase [Rathayibacter oskolensis]|uniref:Pimeloyl-ACP methyl ester carboxylesterase n=1 Tax=Rathayibacter oskolensis TaxID=1891671 RepID=A0A1X7PEI1_9MICO|nr:alpha/beta fold hydrolase [Rathayibacter oskolensis]SMH49738.1 Pimeloyl-ACP methyl ester carboxylesterase [Rathayibacter oskolensis]
MPHLDVPGASLHWEADGHASAPALLLVHAGIADLRMWDPVVPALAEDHLVIRYDSRGFGGSRTDDVDFDERADALAVLEHLGVERASVIGCSRGGSLVLDLTIAHPDRVSGLVTICPGVDGFPYADLTEEEDRRFDEIDTVLKSGDHERVARMEAELWAFGPDRDESSLDPSFVETVRELATGRRGHEHEKPRPIDLDPPAYERVVDIAVPTLVMVGAHDISESFPVYEYLATAIPGASGAVFETAAHLPSVERPEEFLSVLRPWLAEHGI